MRTATAIPTGGQLFLSPSPGSPCARRVRYAFFSSSWGRGANESSAGQYIFFLTYASGSLYKPSSRDFELVHQQVTEGDAERLRTIWTYWEEAESSDEEGVPVADLFHPDHAVAA